MAAATAERPTTRQQEPAAQAPAILDNKLSQAIELLDSKASLYAAELSKPNISRLARSMVMAQAIEQLKSLIGGQVLDRLMSLMNTALGFKTDRPNSKNPQPYGKEVVRDVVAHGLIRGVYPVGNELNIIAGQLYITKEGWQRKINEVPGLTDLVVTPGTPRQVEGRTVVRMGVSWKLNGKQAQLVGGDGQPGLPLAITVHDSTGVDAIIGKAESKALKWAYKQITGSLVDPDDDAGDGPSVHVQSIDPPAADGTQELPAAQQPDADLERAGQFAIEFEQQILDAGTVSQLHSVKEKIEAPENRDLLGARLQGALLDAVKERRAAMVK